MDAPSSEPPIWIEQLKIRSYDVDSTGRATSPALFRYFLEAAWNHAEVLGAGFGDLLRQGKFWALARFRFEVREYPAGSESVTLKTWPRGIKSAFALREFEWSTPDGRLLAAGSSAWLVVDSVTKRPQRLHKLLPSLALLDGRPALSYDPEKLPEIATWDTESSLTARYSDVDVNQHVNSSRYIAWLLDSYPAGFQAVQPLRTLELNYLNETREGDHVLVRTRQAAAGIYFHSIVRLNGPELCRARFEWATPSAG